MNTPGFSAQDSLYRSAGRYRTAGGPGRSATALGRSAGMVQPAAVDETCYNDCYSYCLNPCYDAGGDWYTCAQQCATDAQYCRESCCVEEITCTPDPAHGPDSDCQICDKQFCSGPAVSWSTCPYPIPDPLDAPCYWNGVETPCEVVDWCKQSGVCEAV